MFSEFPVGVVDISGACPGDLIVTEGVQSMRPGVAVKPLAAEALASDARAALKDEG